MKYEKALREWGAKKIESSLSHSPRHSGLTIDRETVFVDMDFNEGYACCGGNDPNCYCTFAEDPSAEVLIKGTATNGLPYQTSIRAEEFNFIVVLGEILEAADGKVTN